MSTGTGFLSSVPGLVDSGLQDTNNDDDSDGDDIDSTIKFGIWSGQQQKHICLVLEQLSSKGVPGSLGGFLNQGSDTV